jgi:trigger factor
MRATTEEVEGNKVRLSVEVEEAEVDKVLEEAVRTMSRQARIPGFRPGKVPRQVLAARMGGAVALRAEALREAIPDFYAQAVAEAEIDPIAAPEIDITAGEENGPLSFDAVVEVRPIVGIPGYGGLRVTVPNPSVSDAEIDAQVDRMRDTEAELVDVDRPAIDGDHVTIDLHGTAEGGDEVAAFDDLLYEVGSGRVAPELDEQLRGAKVGDVLSFEAVPAGAAAPGQDPTQVSFRVLVKDVKEKKLPAVTDEWAAEASEFSTVAELRDDLRQRMRRMKLVQAQLALRQAAMESLAELVDPGEVPEVLVDEELRQRMHDLGHRLEEQGVSIGQLLQATGQSEDDMVDQLRQEARQAVTGDLALRALADAESLEVTDEELEAELDRMAARLELTPAVVRERLTRAGRMAAVRSEQRKAKALAWLLDNVEVVDEEGAPISRDDLRENQAIDEGIVGSGSGEPAAADDGEREEGGEMAGVQESATGDTNGEAQA